ncbi:MAG TPA: hypothetical protein VJ841_04350 [Candidatus Saccharimonadales bacterium]|nr:hypothetical protein [Candidatus Saccharimonadales bacterium]
MNNLLSERFAAVAAFLRRNKWVLLSIVLVWVAVNIFVYWYVKTEKTVYYWDNSAYWTTAIALLNAFHVSFHTGWEMLQKSFETDYNALPIVPFLPLMDMFGVGRVKFILLTTNLYLLPATLLFTVLALRRLGKKPVRNLLVPFILLFAAASFFPPLLRPVLTGQIDVVGLLVIVGIVWICSKARFSSFSAAGLSMALLLGFSICLLIVLRRWYSFWVLGAAIAYGVSFWLRDWRNIKRILWWIFYLAIAAGVTLGILAKVFPYLLQAYLLDYHDLYSAYMLGGAFGNFERFFYYFGIVSLLVAVVGMVAAFMKKSIRMGSSVALFVVLQGVISYILFTRTQSFSAHHYYLLLPFFLVGMTFILLAIDMVQKKKIRFILYGALTLLAAGMTLSAFVLPTNMLASVRGAFFGEVSPPVVRNDLQEIRELAAFLKAERQPGDMTYVIASSDTFNDSLFRDVTLPEEYVEDVLASAHVDKRDGFPNQFFGATYVIVADPVQTHLPTGQAVVTVLANDILQGRVTNLIELKDFKIDNGVTLRVYRKTAPYDAKYIDSLKTYFKEHYTDYKNLTDIKQ